MQIHCRQYQLPSITKVLASLLTCNTDSSYTLPLTGRAEGACLSLSAADPLIMADSP